ncbi:MAG: phosphoribosylformylglycinamidine cyclo-ligase [Clostridiales bacterium]|nr:phosphoribosylformylglycinamidine cyclo-ligase [Clostridiales bacterium]
MNEYKKAGVDVKAGYKSVELIKKHVKRTMRPEVLGGLGGFGGMFMPDLSKYNKPVLVSGTDGVGTKLKLAFAMDKHDTIGIDCVAMCVNDIACSGGEPLFLLDYIACGKNYPKKIEQIVKGISEGCVQAGCSIVGGETAEMPGFYPKDEYDLAGFCVGVVEKDKIINGSEIEAGDSLIGIPSSGVHSNGFSLIRKIFGDNKEALSKTYKGIEGAIGLELLKPTAIYVNVIKGVSEKFPIKGIAHVTGGGFIENIPRMLPDGLKPIIYKGSWPVLSIFDVIAREGNVDENSMYGTYNMGIGLVLCVKNDFSDKITREFGGYVIGNVGIGDGIEIK